MSSHSHRSASFWGTDCILSLRDSERVSVQPILAIPAVVFLLFGVTLVWCAVGLVKGNRADFLAAGPVVSSQEIQLAGSGEIVLMLEVPRTASDFRTFQIEFQEKQTGRATTLSYSSLTAQEAVYGVTTMKVPFGRATASSPGAYVVRIIGLEAGKDYSGYRLLVSRPYLGRMALQITGVALSGVGMLLCVIWAAWLAGLLKPANG